MRAIPKLGIEAETFEIEQLFGFFDPDNDGSIELKELSKIRAAVVVVAEVRAARAAVEGVAAEGLARVGLVPQRAGEAAPGCAVAGGDRHGHCRRGLVHSEQYDAPGGRRRCRIPLCVGFQEYHVRRLKSNLKKNVEL